MIADFTKDIPLEWLRKNLELELSPEEKAKIEKMGWVPSGAADHASLQVQ